MTPVGSSAGLVCMPAASSSSRTMRKLVVARFVDRGRLARWLRGHAQAAQKRAYILTSVVGGPVACPSPEDAAWMGLPHSTFYDAPSGAVGDPQIVGRMRGICGEFETYGYRRVGPGPQEQGVVVMSKRGCVGSCANTTCNPAGVEVSWPPPTAPTTCRCSRISPWEMMPDAQPALERRYHVGRRGIRVRLRRSGSRRLVTPRGRLGYAIGQSTRASPWPRSRRRSSRDDRRPGASATPTAEPSAGTLILSRR